MPAPGDVARLDQRIGKLEDKVENVAKAVEAIHRVIADARPATVTRHKAYIGAGR